MNSAHLLLLNQLGGGSASSLLSGLRAYYKLDEAGGTRADSSGNGLTLTDNNTVGSAVGKIALAGQFVAASSEYLSHADDALYSFSGSYTLAAWVYFDSLPGGGDFARILQKDAADREYLLTWYAGALSYRLYHYGSGGLSVVEKVSTPTLATWYLVIAWYDSSTGEINLSVNNGAAATTSGATNLTNGTAPFSLGATSTGVSPFNGRIDEVGAWARVLTTVERAQLYNGGAGVTYPAFA